MKKRLLAVLTMVLLLQTSACGGERTEGAVTEPAGQPEKETAETQEAAETGRAAVKDALPDDLDFGGETLTAPPHQPGTHLRRSWQYAPSTNM